MHHVLHHERGQSLAFYALVLAGILVIGFVIWLVLSLVQSSIENLRVYELEGRIVRIDNVRDNGADHYEAGVVTRDGTLETMQNRDSLANGKTNSADWQTRLKLGIGKCFRFTLAGWRWSLLSWFPNIIGMQEISCTGIPSAGE